MVGAEGFEPPTLCSQSRCATRLRYAPTPFSLSHRVGNTLTMLRTDRENQCRTTHETALRTPTRTEASEEGPARPVQSRGRQEKTSFVLCVFAAHPCWRLAAHSCGGLRAMQYRTCHQAPGLSRSRLQLRHWPPCAQP